MKKSVVVTVAFFYALILTGLVYSEPISEDLHLNIQTTHSNGTIFPGTFNFVFNISTTSDCNNIIYSNSTILTTDTRGIISYYLPSVSLNYSEQYFLCYYRNNVLIDSSKIVRSPYSFTAKNVSLSGVIPDTNFYLIGYNMTATYYFGNGSYLVDVNDTLSQLSCANEQVVKWNTTSGLWYCSDVSAPGAGDIDAVNTDGLYLTGGQTSGTVNLVFNETRLNRTIDSRISNYNVSFFNWISNVLSSIGNWSADKSNYYNTTQINQMNASVTNYINTTNQSILNYVENNFMPLSGVGNLTVNNTAYLDGYDSDFFMPLNQSVYGNFDFNDGWLNGGLSIIDGNIYAQSGYFYNISSLSVSNLNINGSLTPYEGFDGQFDLGSEDLRWKDLYLSGQINAVAVNLSGDLIVAGVNISQLIASNNASMNNYLFLTNISMENYVDFMNTSQNNYINYNNQSVINYIN